MTGIRIQSLVLKSVLFSLITTKPLTLSLIIHSNLMSLSLSPTVIRWIRNNLTERSPKVVVDGEISLPTPHFRCSPRSVLGPLLFMIYMDSVTSTLMICCCTKKLSPVMII